jgi:DNA mismatch repair protein MutH
MSGALSGPGAGSRPDEDDEDELGAEVSPLVVDAIGRALQRHFQAIADMPLPDRMLVLLAELEASERTS